MTKSNLNKNDNDKVESTPSPKNNSVKPIDSIDRFINESATKKLTQTKNLNDNNAFIKKNKDILPKFTMNLNPSSSAKKKEITYNNSAIFHKLIKNNLNQSYN